MNAFLSTYDKNIYFSLIILRQVYLLQNSLDDALKQWKLFNTSVQQNDSRLIGAKYVLEQHKKAVGDVSAVQTQLKHLKVNPIHMSHECRCFKFHYLFISHACG